MGTPTRRLAVTVGLIVAGAVLVLVAAGREWSPAAAAVPLPGPSAGGSGADLLPWLPAAGWVALAGAGAVLATRGRSRRVVGALLTVAGAGVAAGGGWALTDAAAPVWSVVAALAGLCVAGAGAVVAARGAAWPALGGRYERGGAPTPAGAADRRPDLWWEALDRGEDPTA